METGAFPEGSFPYPALLSCSTALRWGSNAQNPCPLLPLPCCRPQQHLLTPCTPNVSQQQTLSLVLHDALPTRGCYCC
jgi:hypothetical protein